MNVGIIVTPMTRGQITIPKAYRDELKITSTTPLNITLEDGKIVVQPLTKVISDQSPYVISPKYSKKEALRKLQEISAYMKKHGPLWTTEEDRRRELSIKKEKSWDW